MVSLRPSRGSVLALALVATATTVGCGGSSASPCATAACQPDGGDASADVAVPDGGAGANDAAIADLIDAPPASPLIAVDIAWAVAHVADPGVIFVDARRASAHAAGHLPGAVSLDAEDLLVMSASYSQVVDAAAFAARVGRAGIARAAIVVVYEDAVGYHAGRLFWTMEYFDHPDVRILDGGLGAWKAAGQSLETGPGTRAATTYPIPTPRSERIADAAWIIAHLDDAAMRAVDARGSSEYGAGHIPKAVNVDWTTTLTGGRLKPRADLEALFVGRGVLPAHAVVTYCSYGYRASVDYLVLRHLGYSDVRVYDRSWAEWGSRSDLPKEP